MTLRMQNPLLRRKLIDRRHQVQTSATGVVTVFVRDKWQTGLVGIDIELWQFSFKAEPGDVLAQVQRRLEQ